MHAPDVFDAPERREQVIATGRVFLAGSALFATYLEPVQPLQSSILIEGLLVVYLIVSLVLWLALRARPTSEPAVCIGAHTADLLCTTALTVLSHTAEGSVFFLFFTFVLLAAAYRWGLKGTLITAEAGVVLLAGEAYALHPASLPARLFGNAGLLMGPQFAFGHLVVRCVYLVLVGLLLGYLAEGEKALQTEAAATARVVAKAQLGGGIESTLEGMLNELMSTFGVVYATIVVEETEGGRMYVWEARRLARGNRLHLTARPIVPEEQADYRSPREAGPWFARRTRSGTYRVADLGHAQLREHSAGAAPAAVPPALAGCTTVLAAPFGLREQGQGWVYVLGVKGRLTWKKKLALLHRIVGAAAPAAYNAYLVGRLRSQIGAQERGRVARELHDGPIQSLVAAELEMNVLRRQRAAGPAELAGQLDSLERLVHDQVLNLRDLMEKIRPIDPDPRRLPEFLAEQVEKFQRETGITAAFAADGPPPNLTGRSSRELIRIAQELLFNVRRHSAARRVDVSLRSSNGSCTLQVADDGRGFDFDGRYNQKALEGMRKGPRVVQERVRLLGGTLAIESHPGEGARVEVTLPQRKG